MNVFDVLKAELKKYLFVISKCIQTADYKVDPVFLNQLPSCVEKIDELAKCFFGTEFEKEIRNIAKISSLLRDELFRYYNDGSESEIESALVIYPKITSLIYAFAYLEELKNNANNLRFIVINHKSCLGATLMISYPDFKENFEERVAVIRPGEFGYFITATPEDNITLHFRYKESFADDFTKYETITLDNLHPGFNVFSFGNNPMENDFVYKITLDADNKFLKLIGKDPELL